VSSVGRFHPCEEPSQSLREGFFAFYQRFKDRLREYDALLSERGGDYALRKRRLDEVAALVEAFGLAPSAEIELHVLADPGVDLGALIQSLHEYIVKGVQECRDLEPFMPAHVGDLRRLAGRLESWGMYWHANVLYATEKYSRAMSTFERILKQDPAFPRRDSIYASLALAWEHIVGDLDRADVFYSELIIAREEQFRAAVRVDGGRIGWEGMPVVVAGGRLELTPLEALALACERRGDLRMKQRRFRRAAEDFARAAELRRDDPVTRRKVRKARWMSLLWPF